MKVKEFFFNNDTCCGCMACTSVCPKNALTITEHKDGFLYPNLNTDLCISCGKCINICPVEKNEELKQNVLDVYGAKAKDTEILKKSQSEGMGFLLGKSVIEQGGTVYGAVLCEDLVTRHKRCETVEELHRTQGSKYVQSYIDKELYNQIETDLKTNKIILFTGTPCQCAGVKSLFGKYHNLFLVEIICHGVMSPGFAKSYIEYKKKQANKKIIHIDYRTNKYVTWGSGSVVVVVYSDNTEKCFTDYTNVFLSDILLRKNCYNCNFANKYRISDITIGDFWGIQKEKPEFYDEKGVSAVLINSEKGQILFSDIKNKIVNFKTNVEIISKYNPRLIKSMGYNKKRDFYSLVYEKYNLASVIKFQQIYNKLNIKKRIYLIATKIKNIIYRNNYV